MLFSGGCATMAADSYRTKTRGYRPGGRLRGRCGGCGREAHSNMETVTHTFDPVFDERSRVLILGTMPSPKSRQAGFYYGHPQNRFWPVLAALFGERTPVGTQERRAFALAHRVALWDVLYRCEIDGASDASIRNPAPNDLNRLLARTEIRGIFANGQKAAALYEKYCRAETGRDCVRLPSTSPANCRAAFPALVDSYRVILDCL